MIRSAVTYLATLVVFLAIDSVWLSQTAGPLYRATLGDSLLDQFRLMPAILFYLLNTLGIVIFVSRPAMRNGGGWSHALSHGALFGIFTYATYDLTNYATLRVWSLQLTVADMIWGAAVTGLSASVGVLIAASLTRKLARA
jgi:uncharacterized membrane protein